MTTIAPLAAPSKMRTSQEVPSEQIDALFHQWDRVDSPGFAVAVVQNGQVVFQKGYGMANLQSQTPITPTTVFDVASTSKQFTGTSILLLEEAGKLSQDEDVHKHLPELPDYGAPVTIRHMLHHTSGLPEYDVNNPEMTTNEQMLDDMTKRDKLDFPPGDQFVYTNSNYSLLGQIVERASGMPLRDFAAANIFAPLGMQQTQIRQDYTAPIEGRATGYTQTEDGQFAVSEFPNGITGDGNVHTTVLDLAKWNANFYHNRLGQGEAALIDKLETPTQLNNGDPVNYCCGVEVDEYQGSKRVMHSGAWTGFESCFMQFPQKGLTVICLSNLETVSAVDQAQQVADLMLG